MDYVWESIWGALRKFPYFCGVESASGSTLTIMYKDPETGLLHKGDKPLVCEIEACDDNGLEASFAEPGFVWVEAHDSSPITVLHELAHVVLHFPPLSLSGVTDRVECEIEAWSHALKWHNTALNREEINLVSFSLGSYYDITKIYRHDKAPEARQKIDEFLACLA